MAYAGDIALDKAKSTEGLERRGGVAALYGLPPAASLPASRSAPSQGPCQDVLNRVAFLHAPSEHGSHKVVAGFLRR